MALTRWPTEPNPKLLPWAIWRFKNRPGPSPWPTGNGVKIPEYAWEFLKWVEWKRKLARGIDAPRPDICKKLPASWPWAYLKQINVAVPQAPPPPPPPPAQEVPPDSWKLRYPAIFTSHGWALDSKFRTDEALRLMQNAGVGAVGLQGGMFLDDTGDRIRDYGMDVFIWGSANSRDQAYIDQAGATGYMPQVEGKYEYDSAFANFVAGVGKNISRSIVTTNASFDTFIRRPNGTVEGESTTEQAEALIKLGITNAHVECYLADMTPVDVDNMVWQSKHRGIYYVHPCLSYLGIESTKFGRQVSVFLAEPMSDAQYLQLKAL